MIILFGAGLCHTSNRDELLLSVSFLIRITEVSGLMTVEIVWLYMYCHTWSWKLVTNG